MREAGLRRPHTGVHPAEAIRRFYEEHPYPPPENDLGAYRERWRDVERRRADYHLRWPAASYREDRSVLVAGCGTSQAAKYALRWPDATVIGIDVSTGSLENSEALKRKHDIDNLELHQLSVEDAAKLGRSFDRIVCTGVLHHLPEPDVGLKVLRGLLAPGGIVDLMVYAPYGRAGVYLLQEYCRRLGIGVSKREITDLGASLSSLPQDHPIVPLLQNSPDFQSEAGLADALLNPQDRAYSVPELFELAAQCGLRFGRWVRQAPYLPHCGAMLASPHQSRLARLPQEEQYAALELFRGTMVRHSAILYKDGEPADRYTPGFDGDRWLDYVPIRLPNTICVEERLPPTAAGVLINRSHTNTDIYLPVDKRQKEMVEAIDGRRPISSIAATSALQQTARTLFERLWWYDQIVFESGDRE